MPSAPSARRGFSPLDEELGLLAGQFTPSLVESMVRLGTWMSFGAGAKMIAHFTRVGLSASTVRRQTEGSGQAYVAVQAAELERLERETPEVPAGPAVQQVSVDGAMVPLVGGQWSEAKTLAVGVVQRSEGREGQVVAHTEDLSYFSRLGEAESFSRGATVEMHRRGTERAGVVCAVVDGADWEQKFIDLHCPGAVRILDWAHAAEYVVKAGQAAFGAGTAALSGWLEGQLHELRHGQAKPVLQALERLWVEVALEVAEGERREEALGIVEGSLAYLSKRRDQIRYAEFAAQGYPIGSGVVESANKLVVEARLKGAGMHWAPAHVSPMVALRTVACSDRWEEAWPQISGRLRQQQAERAQQRRAERQAKQVAVVTDGTIAAANAAPSPTSVTLPNPIRTASASPSSVTQRTGDAWKPGPNHYWRRCRIGKAIYAGPKPLASAES